MPSWAIERRAIAFRQAGVLAALAAGLCAWSGSAMAQNQPTSLLPVPNPPTVILSPSAAVSPAKPAAETEPITGTAPSGSPVQVQQLSGLDINGFGTLDESHGGLPSGFWSGTDAAVADKLLSILRPTASRPMQDLARAVLLSVATPPAVAAGSPAPSDPIIVRRAKTLWTLGRADDLANLLKSLPAPAITPPLRRIRADAALLVGDSPTACAEAAPLAAASTSDPYPVELRVYCQFVVGQASAASLGIDVLREQGVTDPEFFALADALAGTVPLAKRSIAPSSALILAMARLAKADIADPGPDSPAMVSRALALVSGPLLDIRLAAGEQAEAVGALDADTLRRLYASVPFTGEDLASAESKAASLPAPRSHALLFQASDKQAAPLAKAGLIARALNGADGPAFFVQARVYAPQIVALQPSTDIALYVPALAKALLAAHQFDAARAWLGWIKAQAAADKSAAGVEAGLVVQARIAQLADAPLTSDQFKAWRDAAGGLPADRTARRTDLALALLTAVGDAPPADAWLAQLGNGASVTVQAPNPALVLGLDAAVAGKRTGEIILDSYAMLGDGTLTQIDVADLARVVAALTAVGFKDEARSLALDAALANGL